MATLLPSEWATKKPIEKYETQFFYIGLSRYDTVKKTLSSIVRTPEGKMLYTETPYEGNLARCYVTEYATVTIYSHTPRVWVEDLGVNDRHAFVQKQPTQVS
jgi:hypothetical protein